MKYASVELSIDRSIVRLTFETVPEGYEQFQRVTIQADDLFTLLVHADESFREEPSPMGLGTVSGRANRSEGK